MWFPQKKTGRSAISISSLVAAGILAASGEAIASMSEAEISTFEEKIADADSDELNKLEISVARLLQQDPSDVGATYLMSTLLLKMFTTDPGNYSLIRQSTELAAQSYDLDKKSDLSIAALANILEVTGENDRGLALIADSRKHGIVLGWRAQFAKAKLMFNGRNSDVVLRELEILSRERQASGEILAPLIISTVNARYDGETLLEKLEFWSGKCPSIKLSLAVANAMAINGHYKDAMRLYSKIDILRPDIAESHLSQGLIALRKLKEYDIALKHLRLAIGLSKSRSEITAAKTHYAIGLLITGRGGQESLNASLDAVSSAADPEATLLAILGTMRKQSEPNAMMAFLDGLEIARPGLHLGYALKAETLSEKMGRHHDAMRSYTAAITLEPGRAEYYNGRGITWMSMGKLKEALYDFESAIEVNPEDASARYNEACAQARLGRLEEALDSLSKAISLDQRLSMIARTDSDLKSLRVDPRFTEILNRKGQTVQVAH